MKGIIVKCLKDMVQENFGTDKWVKILESSDLDPDLAIKAHDDIEDAIVLKVVESTCNVLNVSLSQAADAFGDYWVNVFAPKIYDVYYKGSTTAREFILKMDEVHSRVTKNIENARPPRFEYEWKSDTNLLVTYKSHRGLIDFFVGLAKGVGKYFNENLVVTKLSDNQVEIIFES